MKNIKQAVEQPTTIEEAEKNLTSMINYALNEFN